MIFNFQIARLNLQMLNLCAQFIVHADKSHNKACKLKINFVPKTLHCQNRNLRKVLVLEIQM